ncbi:MAG TPA: histidine phosphatase family protein [Bryobacteraceae bacterium]|nr:histidine phosphatase family protein [Bryobacteraceae bacterium]
MRIYLLRHAIAEPGRPGQPDSDRALTPEGREKLKGVMRRARAAGVAPSVILASPYRRAMETAEDAKQALGSTCDIERSGKLTPDASPYDVWEEIRLHRSENSILLASHEPLMSSLAAFLLGVPALQVDMKKAALLRIDCESFGPNPRGMLKWMLTPATASD